MYMMCGALFAGVIYFFYRKKMKKLQGQPAATTPTQEPTETNLTFVDTPAAVYANVPRTAVAKVILKPREVERSLDPAIFEKQIDRVKDTMGVERHEIGSGISSANVANVNEMERDSDQEFVDDAPLDEFQEAKPLETANPATDANETNSVVEPDTAEGSGEILPVAEPVQTGPRRRVSKQTSKQAKKLQDVQPGRIISI